MLPLKKLIPFILLAGSLLLPGLLCAQTVTNLRMKSFKVRQDTLSLDTLSVVPGSFFITTDKGKTIPESYYTTDFAAAKLIWHFPQGTVDTSVNYVITYRVFPFLFTQSSSHKKREHIEIDAQGDYKPYIYSYSDANEDLFKLGGLSKNGSISRGISFGNNQDVVVNSSMNLQLSGKLSDDIGILAAITDNNIPIQPEGNTQQIQEFDKVYIQLFTKSTRLTAGDFELLRPQSYFMNLTKKAQGGLLTSQFSLWDKDKKKSYGAMDVAVSGAISKGKYARNNISGSEGNQGPYKLTGSEGETYIIVLAGSEKVFIDGKLMTRGADQDYIIDYNLGEITFTPEHMITKDKRIVVEFEYSDRSYARSMYFASVGYKAKTGGVRFHFFSEQDQKNQPLQQELSESEKQLLFDIGDSLWLAVVPHVDSVEFNNNEVLYKMVDTTVNSILYDSVYVMSNSPDSAHYRLGFANVGVGKGNYVQVQSASNGRVFKWVAPLSGVPQGNYEPVMVLVSPRKTQMYTVNGDYRIGKHTTLMAEVAMSNKDENTFSPGDSYDDIGYAGRFSVENVLALGHDSIKGWKMVSGIQHEYVQQYFQPIERFRTVEFDRDWNLNNITTRADEQLPGLHLSFENRRNQFFTYRFKSFLKGSQYKGYRHSLDLAYDVKNFFITFNGSYLTSDAPSYSSTFFRQNGQLQKKFKWFTVGVREAQDHNLLSPGIADSLLGGSFAFEEYEAFLQSPDTAKTRFSGFYKRRLDRLPYDGSLRLATTADDAGMGFELGRNPSQLLKIKGSWRTLTINDSSLSTAQQENTLLGRIEFFMRKFKKVLTSNTFYEAGSGLEVKKEFSYLEVPSGQGIYAWTDYNGNNVKELNEFDVAAFADQANYIRVFTPTSEYIRAFYSQFSEALNVDPANAWANKKGFRKFVSRWSLQFAYRVERKTSDERLLNAYNPFQSGISDTNLLSLNSNLRASLYFNKSHPKFGADISYQDSRNKVLLVNGFDSRTQQFLSSHLRWNINKKITINTDGTYGFKTSHSEYFVNRAYDIVYWDIQPKFQYMPVNTFRIVVMYKYAHKINAGGNPQETAKMHDAGLELKYNMIGKGSLVLKGNYILIDFNASENNPLAYDMLEGYKKGNNATWNLSYQRNISENLQLNIMYDGRKSAESKMVHVGSVQLRAYF